MQLDSIGSIHSCFKEKFATPRQSGLVPASDGVITIHKKYSNIDAFKDLEAFDFIWVIFGFHLNKGSEQKWHPTVRPPRLGGNKRLSTFATRSPYRPNPIGLSLVKLTKVEITNAQVQLCIQGHDIVEGTPIFDIKPYHPQADVPWQSFKNGWIDEVEDIVYSVEFGRELESLEILDENLKQKITEVLRLDPRPRYQDDENRVYGNLIDSVNVQWRVSENRVIIVDIKKIN